MTLSSAKSIPYGSCLTVSYHYVRDATGRFAKLKALPAPDFSLQLGILAHGREVVDAAAFLDVVEGRRALDAPSVLLTFDDGLLDHYTTVFPALRSRSLSGMFFISSRSNSTPPRVLNVQKVQLLLASLGGERLLAEASELAARAGFVPPDTPPDPVLYRYDTPADRAVKRLLNYELPYDTLDGVLTALFERHIGAEADVATELYLTESMVREMSAAGMTFGFHTQNHRVLSRLSAREQRAEIEHGIAWIRELTGQSHVPFCYPHGHALAFNRETVAVLREAGYSMAFTAVRDFTRPSAACRFELPRYDTCDVESVLGLERQAAASL